MESISSTAFGDQGTHRRVRAILRSEGMFVEAFEITPVLDAEVLFQTLKALRRSRTPKNALRNLIRFTLLVKMVGELATRLAEWSRDFHGLSQENFDFLIGCWRHAGQPLSGATVTWR